MADEEAPSPPELTREEATEAVVRSRAVRSDALRTAVERLAHGGSAGHQGVDAALACLSPGGPQPRCWQEPALAAWVLGLAEETLEKRDLALPLLRRAAVGKSFGTARGTLRRGLGWAGRIGLGFAVVGGVTTAFAIIVATPLATGSLGTAGSAALALAVALIGVVLASTLATVCAFPVAASMAAVAGRVAGPRVRAEAVRALGRIGDPAGVAVPATAACDRNPAVAEAGREALMATLPLLTAEHYGALEPGAVLALCAALTCHADPVDQRAPADAIDGVALCVLHALERMGDGRAVEPVARAAAHARSQVVRDLAVRVLPVLVARRQAEQAAARLLRPADTPPDAGLLRPAVPPAPAEQLLRPAEREDDTATRSNT